LIQFVVFDSTNFPLMKSGTLCGVELTNRLSRSMGLFEQDLKGHATGSYAFGYVRVRLA
jgi:hypothetical protein